MEIYAEAPKILKFDKKGKAGLQREKCEQSNNISAVQLVTFFGEIRGGIIKREEGELREGILCF